MSESDRIDTILDSLEARVNAAEVELAQIKQESP